MTNKAKSFHKLKSNSALLATSALLAPFQDMLSHVLPPRTKIHQVNPLAILAQSAITVLEQQLTQFHALVAIGVRWVFLNPQHVPSAISVRTQSSKLKVTAQFARRVATVLSLVPMPPQVFAMPVTTAMRVLLFLKRTIAPLVAIASKVPSRRLPVPLVTTTSIQT